MQKYLDSLSRELRQRNYSPKTINAYITCNRVFLSYIQSDITTITREKVIDFILLLQSQKKAPKTVNLYKEAIKFFLREIVCITTPIDIKLSKEPNKLPVVLSKGEIERMLEVMKNAKHRLILSIAYGSGLRVSEVIELRVKDSDLDTKVLTIRGGKGQKDRVSVLSDKILGDLGKIISLKEKNDYIFESERGGKLTTRTLQNIFAQALKKAEIKKDATFHSLRHSFATHLLENGVDVRYIQELLGHANIRTTQIYTKVMNPNLRNIHSPL